MNRADATQMIGRLMREHGLLDSGWTWRWDRAKRRLGQCQYSNKRLSFSLPLFSINDEAQCVDTVLHEIAHALTPGSGHGAEWRMKCREIGATPRSCARSSEVTSVPHRWRGTCACVDKVFRRHRLTAGARTGLCPSCRVSITWQDARAYA